MIPLNYSFDHCPLTSTEIKQMIHSCTLQFEQMKRDNESLFQMSPNILEMDTQAIFPILYDIDMDEEEVFVIPVKNFPFLGTSGLSTCIAVTAKGETENGEIFIGLSHICFIPVKEILEGMTKSFRQRGCSEKSIEFYIIGGMLPNEEPDGDTDSSFEKQKEFIALKDEYNIKSVYFNHINNGEDSLSVVMTKDGAQWTTRHDALNVLSESSEEDYNSANSSNESEISSSEESNSSDDDESESLSNSSEESSYEIRNDKRKKSDSSDESREKKKTKYT